MGIPYYGAVEAKTVLTDNWLAGIDDLRHCLHRCTIIFWAHTPHNGKGALISDDVHMSGCLFVANIST